MSTRTNVLITDGTRENTIQFYHHSDGYVEGVGYDLAKYLKKLVGKVKGEKYLATPNNFAPWLGCNPFDNGYELEDEVNTHGDIQYLYIVDTQARTLTCYKVLAWCSPTESALLAVEGKVKEAIYFGLIFQIPFGQGIQAIKKSMAEIGRHDCREKHELLEQMINRGEIDTWLWSY